GRHVAREDRELLNGIHVRNNQSSAQLEICHRGAVQRPASEDVPLPIHRDVYIAGPNLASVILRELAARDEGGAGRQLRQFPEVAPVQRQFGNLRRRDQMADLGGGGGKQRHGGIDGDLLRRVAELQREIDGG